MPDTSSPVVSATQAVQSAISATPGNTITISGIRVTDNLAISSIYGHLWGPNGGYVDSIGLTYTYTSTNDIILTATATIPTYTGLTNGSYKIGIYAVDASHNQSSETTVGTVSVTGFASSTTGNDTLTGGSGVLMDGLAGIDTVTYTGNHGSIIHNSDGSYTVGSDKLTNIERLQFADKKIALDVTTEGNAGKALEFIGMLAFDKVTDKAIVGEIISYFDQMPSMHDICQLAIGGGLTKALAGSDSNAALAQLVFRNVVGHEASAGDVDSLVSYMDGRNASMSQADFLTAIAGLELNNQHIGLVGLQSTGVEYII